MLSHDLSRRLSQKQRLWQRLQREKAMQRQTLTRHARELGEIVKAAKERAQTRAKLQDMSLHRT